MLLWHRCDPRPRNFHMSPVWPRKKEKKAPIKYEHILNRCKLYMNVRRKARASQGNVELVLLGAGLSRLRLQPVRVSLLAPPLETVPRPPRLTLLLGCKALAALSTGMLQTWRVRAPHVPRPPLSREKERESWEAQRSAAGSSPAGCPLRHSTFPQTVNESPGQGLSLCGAGVWLSATFWKLLSYFPKENFCIFPSACVLTPQPVSTLDH